MLFDSGTFDVDGFDDIPLFWTLDTILSLTNTETFSLDAHILSQRSAPFRLDLRIGSPSWQFALDMILVLQRDSPRFQESIINAMFWSYGRAIEKLSESIDIMGASLKLPDAPVEDLDLYWSKMLGIKRRSGEPDEDFRMRLATRLSILSSSGTKAEIEAIINRILEMDNATRIDTYPGEITVNWTSIVAAKLAKAKYNAVKEALDLATMAGVNWYTSFPYQDWDMDINLAGPHFSKFALDVAISRRYTAIFSLGTNLLNTHVSYWSTDSNIQGPNNTSWLTDMRLIAANSETFVLDGILKAGQSQDWNMDQVLVGRPSRNQLLDMVAVATHFNVYKVDMLASKSKRGFFMVDMELAAA